MRFSSNVLRSLLLGTTAAALAMPAWAQTTPEEQAQTVNPTTVTTVATPEDEEEILVTATKRSTRVQDVPFSINAQTQEDIQRANASTIEDISRNVAGLAVQNLGPGQSQVTIRGVSAGQIVRDQPGVKEQVGVYMDESVISLSLFTPDFDLFDLNRVETLRGPQGTLFGSGSVGGTVRYITNQPRLGESSSLFEANVNVAAGGDIGYHLKGAVNAPLTDTLAIRAVGYGTHYPGFIDALGPASGDNVNDGGRVGGRVAVLWEPTPDIKVTPRVIYQKVDTDGFNREEVFNLYANPFTIPPHNFDDREQYLLQRESFRDETVLADLTASWAFGAVELTSITSYIDRDILVSRDASALTGSVSVDLEFPDAGVNLPSNLRDTTRLKQWTQEVRLASTGEGPLQWLIGGFYTDINRDYRQRLPTPGYDVFLNQFFADICTADPGDCADPILGIPVTTADLANGFPLDSPYNANVPYDINQKAVFGEASYDFGQFKLTAGGRYYDFKEERDFISGGFFSTGNTILGDKTKSSGISPRVIGTWEPNRNLSVNVQAAKGFRLGGINDPLNLNLCSATDAILYGPFAGEYDDETLWNYEGGVKYQRGGITFNAAAFYTDVRDLQINVDAGGCSSRVSINAPRAHTMGLEAEVAARPMPGLELSFAGSLVEAEFDESLDAEDLRVATGIREGNRLPGVPKIQLAATATYGSRFSDNADWYVNASVQHIGSRYTQAADQEANPRTFAHGLPFNGMTGDEVTVLNLKLPSYELVNLSFGLEFDNGLDVVLYANNVLDESPRLSFNRERGGRARLGYHVGQPRIIGLTLRKAFGR